MAMKNVILDWSGTLADDLTPVLSATNRILQEHGHGGLSLEEFRLEFELPFDRFYQRLIPGTTLEDIDPLYHRFFEFFQGDVELLPHARRFLDHCRDRGCRLFLLSTIKPEHFHQQSAKLGVADLFEEAYVGVMDKSLMILEILERHRLDPGQTLFVGDMRHDIDTARHGGVLSVATLTGYDPPEKLLASQPDVMVRDLGELLRIVELGSNNSLPVATVGALLQHDEEVLMIRTHKWSDKWGIPGGKIRRGETSLEALRREVMEETGLRIGEPRFAMVQDCVDSEEFIRPAHFLLLNYVARVDRREVVLNEEAEEFVWIDPATALSTLELNQPSRILLEWAVEQRQLV